MAWQAQTALTPPQRAVRTKGPQYLPEVETVMPNDNEAASNTLSPHISSQLISKGLLPNSATSLSTFTKLLHTLGGPACGVGGDSNRTGHLDAPLRGPHREDNHFTGGYRFPEPCSPSTRTMKHQEAAVTVFQKVEAQWMERTEFG